MSARITCPCGRTNPDSARFCNGCGRSLGASAPTLRTDAPAPQESLARQWGGVIFLLLVILGAAAFVLWPSLQPLLKGVEQATVNRYANFPAKAGGDSLRTVELVGVSPEGILELRVTNTAPESIRWDHAQAYFFDRFNDQVGVLESPESGVLRSGESYTLHLGPIPSNATYAKLAVGG